MYFKLMIGCFCEYNEDIAKALTFEINRDIGRKKRPPEIIKLFKIIGRKMVIPRFFAPHEIKSEMSYAPIDHEININLSKNQQVIYTAALQKLEEEGGCTLVVKTGEGKTYIAAALIKQIAGRTLVVVHNAEILDYWVKILPATKFYSGERFKSVLTIGLINTLLKQPREWFAEFDFIVFDEITEFVSEIRREIFWHAPKFILGLTATPEIKGIKHKIFTFHAGPILRAADLKDYNATQIDWRVKIEIIKYYGDPEYTQALCSRIGYISAIAMSQQFAADPVRTKLITDRIAELIAAGKNIFVFCITCDFAKKLFNLCSLVEPRKAVLMGREKTAEMEEIIEKSQVIYTTYSFCSKGISIIKMDALVLAQPRKSDSVQTFGRILRIGGDTTRERIIIDIVDAATSIKSQYYVRKKVYDELFSNAERKIKIIR